MASALAKFKKIPNAIGRLGAGQKASFGSVVVDKAERYGAAAAFGYVKGRYREKATVKGQPIDLVAGLGALGLGILDEVFLGGHFAPHLNRIGDAGLSSYINSRATFLGHKAAGRKVYVSQPGANPALPAGLQQVDVLGELDSMGGAYLSDAQVQRFAQAR
jgi:hypothetical protein